MSAPNAVTATRGAFLSVGENDGGKGRGFVVATPDDRRLVITAAHCLPHLPAAHPGRFDEERSYANVLGRIDADLTVCAACLFVDPIADIAVLCEPDSQTSGDEWDAYGALVDNVVPLQIGVLKGDSSAWLLTLDGSWERCDVRLNPYERGASRTLTVVGAKNGMLSGTSGSPILGDDGRALGIVAVTGDVSGRMLEEQWGQPLIAGVLPSWLSSLLTGSTGVKGMLH